MSTGQTVARTGRSVSMLAAALCLLLTACQSMAPRTATQPAVPTEGNGALMNYIADQPYVTVEPAYRAIYILWKGEVFEGDFQPLADQLTAAGIVQPTWNHAPDALLGRGPVGYMLCRAADVRTGLNWRLTGMGRYAWRELNYLKIASPISEYGYVPGGQFIGVLARAEDYMHRVRGDGTEPVELGAAP